MLYIMVTVRIEKDIIEKTENSLGYNTAKYSCNAGNPYLFDYLYIINKKEVEVMFKVGDKIDYGVYTNLTIESEDDAHFTLVDSSGISKKVFKHLVQSNSFYHGDSHSDKTILLKDGTEYKISHFRNSETTVKCLVLTLDELLKKEGRPVDKIMHWVELRLNKKYPVTLAKCELVLSEAVLPELSLRKILHKLGVTDSMIERMNKHALYE